jgi:hypothetical protein
MVWYGVLELLVTVVAYTCVALRLQVCSVVATYNIAEIIVFNVSQLVFCTEGPSFISMPV